MGWNVCKIGKVSQIFLQTGIYSVLNITCAKRNRYDKKAPDILCISVVYPERF